MALFRISRGDSSRLAEQPLKDGNAWFTPNDGKFYIDADSDGDGNIDRILINPDVDLSGKQDKLTGETGQFVGFDESGNVVAQEVPNVISIEGGADATLTGDFGDAPYTIEFDEEEFEPMLANEIGYDNTVSGLTSEDIQGAIDELKALTKVAPTNTDYEVYRIRNSAILSAVPETMNDGDIAFVYK